MKRKLILILASILILLSLSMLCACGGGNNNGVDNDSLSDIVFTNKEIIYDGEYHTIEALNIPEYATYAYSTDKGFKDVGTYECSFYANLDGEEINLKATLTIKKATLKVFAQEKIIYKGQPANFGYSLSGFKGKDTISIIDVLPTLKAVNYENVGKYNDVISFEGASDNNYEFAYISADFIIEDVAKPQVFNDYVLFGKYPQTLVSDSELLLELENKVSNGEIAEDVDSGWYNYKGVSYSGVVAKTHPMMESYNKFINGSDIVNEKLYFFKVEPIKWNILQKNNGSYLLTTNFLIDNLKFNEKNLNETVDGETILANSWSHSDLRNWLNNDFTLMAFGNSSYVEQYSHLVNNKTVSDKVSVLSLEDVNNSSFGFTDLTSRKALFTDYSRAKEAFMPLDGNGYYWLSDIGGRIQSNDARVKVVKSDGSSGEDCYFMINSNCGLRPCIKISTNV